MAVGDGAIEPTNTNVGMISLLHAGWSVQTNVFEEAILYRLPISFWIEWENGKRDHRELACLVIDYYKVNYLDWK